MKLEEAVTANDYVMVLQASISDCTNEELKLQRELKEAVEQREQLSRKLNRVKRMHFGESKHTRSEGDNYAGASYWRATLKVGTKLLSQEHRGGSFKGFELTKEQCEEIVESIHLYHLPNLKEYLTDKSYKIVTHLLALLELGYLEGDM